MRFTAVQDVVALSAVQVVYSVSAGKIIMTIIAMKGVVAPPTFNDILSVASG